MNKRDEAIRARGVTFQALCGIVKLYERATLAEVAAKYKSIAASHELPFWDLTDHQIRAYLAKAVQDGLMHYEQVRVLGERYQKGRRYGTGYYIWGPKPKDEGFKPKWIVR
jgi:hypothetical protein